MNVYKAEGNVYITLNTVEPYFSNYNNNIKTFCGSCDVNAHFTPLG